MSSPIRRFSLKGKAIATASNSDKSSFPRLHGSRAITLGGMILRPTSEDLAELNDNERSVVQFNLELEEREATGQVAVDDVVHETKPRSTPQNNPSVDVNSVGKDKDSAEKAISLALADLLPMRWTENNFEFDEEIDPEQERRLSVKKNQKWENHFPIRSTFKSVRRLTLQSSPPAGFSFLIPANHQRPWTPPVGFACVYESWFNNCSLWWPLPEFLTTYCSRRKIALGQYTTNRIRILVMLTVLAAKLGIKMPVRLFEELTTLSITAKTGFFYWKMVPKYNMITGKPSKVNFWNRAYFYVKINEASLKDPSVILNGYFNANISMNFESLIIALLLICFISIFFVADRLSKWSHGGSRSFLEEVEAIRTLSHQHWLDISEARVQATLNRINRAEISTERNRNQRMGNLNLASLPSYADTIGTPVHGRESSVDGQPAKRRRSSTVDEGAPIASPNLPPQSERPEEHLGGDDQEPQVQEIPLFESFVKAKLAITDKVPTEEHPVDLPTGEEPQGDQFQDPDETAHSDEMIEYPHMIDFKYQHTDILFVEDHEVPARLFRQIKLKKKGMPELEQLWQNRRY
ncbi:hypothetical protein N665_0652s0007 [Sinapis alba]|nr:hypothetical protein N665_0652s0007 [Sinapis alba]